MKLRGDTGVELQRDGDECLGSGGLRAVLPTNRDVDRHENPRSGALCPGENRKGYRLSILQMNRELPAVLRSDGFARSEYQKRRNCQRLAVHFCAPGQNAREV